MDTELIMKFPCGGSWWTVRHPAACEWQQSFYEGVPSATIPAPMPVPSTPSAQPRQPRSKDVRTNQLVPVCEYIMNTIDPCASLYTVMQKMDAVQWLKQRLFNFVSSDAHMYLGPKKSRVLSLWLSGNASKPDTESMVREFLEFLLGDRAKDVALHMDRRGQWFVKRNGTS